LTKYYTKISSENFAIATVLDPRYKLDVYDSTQDPIALKASAQLAVGSAFEQYSQKLSTDSTLNLGLQIDAPVYLQEDRIGEEELDLNYQSYQFSHTLLSLKLHGYNAF
jgi:hypothetical protein